MEWQWEFDPPCPYFAAHHHHARGPSLPDRGGDRMEEEEEGKDVVGGRNSLTILELGSGQSRASLHLLEELRTLHRSRSGAGHDDRDSDAITGDAVDAHSSRRDRACRLILTDLPEVVPLCRSNLDAHELRDHVDPAGPPSQLPDGGERTVSSGPADVEVVVRPLAWGNDEQMNAIERELAADGRRVTHVLAIDLVSVARTGRPYHNHYHSSPWGSRLRTVFLPWAACAPLDLLPSPLPALALHPPSSRARPLGRRNPHLLQISLARSRGGLLYGLWEGLYHPTSIGSAALAAQGQAGRDVSGSHRSRRMATIRRRAWHPDTGLSQETRVRNAGRTDELRRGPDARDGPLKTL